MIHRLVAIRGPHVGVSYVLNKRVTTLGRDSRNTIQLLDEQASRQHCQLETVGERLFLQDLNSTNGTFVNGKRVTECEVSPGDEISIGKCAFQVQVVDEKSADDRMGERLTLVADRMDLRGEINLSFSAEEGRYHDPANIRPTATNWQRICKDLGFFCETQLFLSRQDGLDALLDALLASVMEAFQPDRAYIFLVDNRTLRLVPRAARARNEAEETEIKVSKEIIETVVRERVSILCTEDEQQEKKRKGFRRAPVGVHSFLCAPIQSSRHLVGVFQIDSLSAKHRFSEDDLHCFMGLCQQVGPILDNAVKRRQQQRVFDSFVTALSTAVDARDGFKVDHSVRVSQIAVGIAETMGLGEKDREIIRYASLLHDIGTVAIKEDLVAKEGQLTVDEFERMKAHAEWTRRILGMVEFPEADREICDIACHHHERMNGKGYPDGLKGEEIPLGSRIIAVADVYEALTSDRSYREALAPDMALSILENSKGSDFDAAVVDAFRSYLENAAEERRTSTNPV